MSVPDRRPLPDGASPERAAAKETIWRLAAAAFGHPTPEFHEALAAGTFHEAFADAWIRVTGQPWARATPCATAPDLESGFIVAFLHGPKGKPVAPLLAGDYEHLLAGHARPVFMLNIGAFYRHFGLKAATEDEGKSDEPDHLASMLEFMAVLAHLESRALAHDRDPSPYRRAQRDFLRRYLGPMLKAVSDALHRSPVRELDPTLQQLVAELPGWADGQIAELEVRVGPYQDPDNSSAARRSLERTTEQRVVDQNLWG